MTRPKRVAVLRCKNLPSFVTWDIADVDALFKDDDLIIEEFARQGVQARSVVWRDRRIDWDEFDLALIRSTWDYIDQREPFLAALGEIEASSCALFNPLEAVRWNSDKRYLFDLASWDIPTVPTYSASIDGADLERLAHGWPGGAVLKPLVGAGGAHVRRVEAELVAQSVQNLSAEHSPEDLLIQPLIESVTAEGEWSFVYVDGELGHVLLKKPAAGDYRAHGIYGGTIEPAEPLPGDLLGVNDILSKLPFDLLYARMDLLRVEGQLSVLELELIEPMLYLHLSPATVVRLAARSIARMDRGE